MEQTSRNNSVRQANGRTSERYLLPLVAACSGAFPGPEVPFPLTRQDLQMLTAEQLEALEAFYDTKFGEPTNSLGYRRAMFAAYIGNSDNWGMLKWSALSAAKAAQIDVAREPHRV
ncbi:hypothetical protein TSOC_011676 [Tetrabaena socialis]|uniref:Uncharacterized protein n=1 Tax=Tetrabaena socialis TaxID=47790 RepID=A0A2J7ZQ19_9CHLO|nr:hypothetical protein TSOC_011676 [Tetrabaena socialis]|eukprot:PNH02352.1 hypothetical protein TSOC_011676 [Tetrabaena socialis]